jgi:hypothetical protein
MLDQTFLIGDLEELIDLQMSKTLNVDRAALLVYLVVEVRVDSLYLIVLLKDKGLHNY